MTREESAFPILTSKPTGRHGRSDDPAKWKEIRRLDRKQRRAITFLQPYNRRRDKFRDVRNALADIQTLNNIDKHRHLHVLEAVALVAPVGMWAPYGGWSADESPSYGFEQESFLGRPLIGKTEVFRWTFDTVPPDIAAQVNMEHHITAGIALYESGEARLFMALLKRLVASVEIVLKRFEVFLPPR